MIRPMWVLRPIAGNQVADRVHQQEDRDDGEHLREHLHDHDRDEAEAPAGEAHARERIGGERAR